MNLLTPEEIEFLFSAWIDSKSVDVTELFNSLESAVVAALAKQTPVIHIDLSTMDEFMQSPVGFDLLPVRKSGVAGDIALYQLPAAPPVPMKPGVH